MAAPYVKCCYCRESIHPSADGRWVGIVSAEAACKYAPDGVHARQIVVQPRR